MKSGRKIIRLMIAGSTAVWPSFFGVARAASSEEETFGFFAIMQQHPIRLKVAVVCLASAVILMLLYGIFRLIKRASRRRKYGGRTTKGKMIERRPSKQFHPSRQRSTSVVKHRSTAYKRPSRYAMHRNRRHADKTYRVPKKKTSRRRYGRSRIWP